MASKCKCCSNQIMNSEFVSCAGLCNELFHIKCVAVNKQMLNSINACPNIRWYCDVCNASNRNMSTSMDQIKDAIGHLSTTLSKDLLQFVGGFTTQMEKFTEKFSSAIVSQVNVTSNNSAENMNVCAYGNDQVKNSSETTPHHELSVASHYDKEPLKSLVISNIGKDVTVDCLEDYLSGKLNIGKDKLSVSLLLPINRSVESMKFFQFKVTVPEVNYGSVNCPKFWPPNVRVRKFVFKNRKTECVTKKRFLDSLDVSLGEPTHYI